MTKAPQTQLDAAVEEKMRQNEERDPVPDDEWGHEWRRGCAHADRARIAELRAKFLGGKR